jgi:hypothetical protein
MSGVVGIATFFLLPNDYETAYFLNEEDKELMRIRMQQSARYADPEEFNVKEVWKTLRDPKSWLTSFNQICVNICSFGFSTFLPTIIKGFGFDSVKTQLLTVPVYIWASAFYLVIANLSDRVRMRAVFMVPLCLVSAVGYAMLLGVDVHARGPLYFATFVCVTGYVCFFFFSFSRMIFAVTIIDNSLASTRQWDWVSVGTQTVIPATISALWQWACSSLLEIVRV